MHRRVAFVAIAALAVAGVTSAVAQSAVPEGATAAGSALQCDQNTLYGITSGGEVLQIDATDGTTASVISMSPATNALGVTRDGSSAWAFENGGNTISTYDAVAGTTTTIANPDPAGNQSAIRGAVDPVTNIYYYASTGTSARLAAYDIDSGVAIGQVGTITGLGGQNGDMAFGSDGTLYVVDGDSVYQVGMVPAVAGSSNLPATQIATLPNGTNSPGIAYSADGYLFLAVSGQPTIYKINPSSGANVGTVTISSGQAVVDLATCNYSNSLRGQTDVRDRVASTDQFTITNSGNGIASGNVATTTGTSTGVQSAVAGPNLTLGGLNYSVTQSASGTTNLSNYSVTWTCTDWTTATEIAQGSGNTATFTNPMTATADGTDVVCSFLTAVRPGAVDDNYTTPINTTLAINPAGGLLSNDTGTAITVTDNTAPSHGTVSIAADGSLSFAPTNGFTGTDTFDYTITDVNDTTATATVTIEIVPVVTDDSYSTPADTPLVISDLTANDVPTTMTVQSVTDPTNGAAVLNSDGTVTYTPASGYSGPDSFSYTATDSNGYPLTAAVTITVAAKAADDTATGQPNAPVVLMPLTNDTPSAGATFDPATLRIFDTASSSWVLKVAQASVGTWEVIGSELKFTPVPGFAGTASIVYQVDDTASNTVTATASAFYLPTEALAYTNGDRAEAGIPLAAGFGALLIGLALVLVAGHQRRMRPKRAPRHSAAVA